MSSVMLASITAKCRPDGPGLMSTILATSAQEASFSQEGKVLIDSLPARGNHSSAPVLMFGSK